MPTPVVRFLRRFTRPCGVRVARNVTSIEKRGRGDGCSASARRTHRGEVAQDEERDATSDLLLKHPDPTLATYV